MKNGGVIIKYLAIAVCVFSLAFILSACGEKNGKKDQIEKVVRGNLQTLLPTTGIVIPRNRLEIKPPVSGRIEQVLVVEGQNVRKGQVLAWMSSSERAAMLDAAREKGPEEVAYWQDVYKPAPIIAPINGFIIKRNMEPGQSFNTSDAVLVEADRLIVEAQVDETDIGRIGLNKKATVVLDAYPNENITGYVEHIAYESDTISNVTVYRVDMLPYNVPSFFRAGMSATVNFEMEEKSNVLYLPLTAIKKKNKRSYAFIRQNDKIEAVEVQTGMENNENVEIVSGLGEGQVVVVPTALIIKQTLDSVSMRSPLGFLGGGNRRGR
ncbi:MAG: efflux RND transporter periplasmic adaptor subunit [Candidatus Margulisiibacteriota bacterium]